MTNKLKKMLDGEFVINVLLYGAALIFIINLLMAAAPALRIFPEHPFVAILNVILALTKSIYQPAILLALAKMISMKQAKTV